MFRSEPHLDRLQLQLELKAMHPSFPSRVASSGLSIYLITVSFIGEQNHHHGYLIADRCVTLHLYVPK
jgi:hypothetical protein